MTSQLCAIALNPPTTNGLRTAKHLRVAAEIIGCSDLVIVNLFSVPTRNVLDINEAGTDWDGWLNARPQLGSGISSSDAVIVAWGVRGLTGLARDNFRQQVEWVFSELAASEHDQVWTINGEARHASRWHQYVSDQHGRTTGGDFETRLQQVLQRSSISTPEL